MSERTKVAAKATEAKRENSVSQQRRTGPSQLMRSPVEKILFLQRTIGNQRVQGLIRSGALQTKLKINTPGDRYEQEADRVAERVVASKPMQAPHEGKAQVQRKSISDAQTAPVADNFIQNLGPGQPLDTATRAFFEPRFGHDFSHVRVHSDARAAEAARAVNARAFTVGRDVVFGMAQYQPESTAGRQLLAHEMAHVMQQQRRRTDLEVDAGTKLTAQSCFQADRMELQISKPSALIQLNGPNSRGHIASDFTPAPTGILQCQFATGKGGVRERERRSAFEAGLTVDPAYAEIALAIQTGWRMVAALDETTLRRATVDQRIVMLTQLTDAYWTGGAEEEAIILILSTTPSLDAPTLIEWLDAQLKTGRSLLDELNRVVDFGNNLDLYTEISKLRLKAMPSTKVIKALENAPILPWHDVMGIFEDNATFQFWLTEEGKIRISYYRGTVLASSTHFADEIQQLPQDLFIYGHDYDPNQLLIIHDYDKGQFVPVIARDLLGYRNSGIRTFLSHAGEVTSLVLPAGPAKTLVGKVAVIALERVLPVTSVLINENRLNIIKWFPNWGPKMLYFADIFQMAVGLYGIVRFAVAGVRIIKSWQDVRNARKVLEGAIFDPEAEAVARQLESNFDKIAEELEKVRESEESAVRRVTSAETGTPEQPKGKVLSLEGRSRVGTVEGLENLTPGKQDVTNLSEFKLRKALTPPPPSEPSVQSMPQTLEEAQVGEAKLAAGAEFSTPKTGESITGGPVASIGSGKKMPSKLATLPKVQKGTKPLYEHQNTDYRRFGTKSRLGDLFEGHEVLMNSWLERLGIIKKRGVGNISRANSAIALTVEQHDIVSAMQRQAGLYDETVIAKMGLYEVLEKNAQILLDAGVPMDRVVEVIDYALEMYPALVGKVPL